MQFNGRSVSSVYLITHQNFLFILQDVLDSSVLLFLLNHFFYLKNSSHLISFTPVLSSFYPLPETGHSPLICPTIQLIIFITPLYIPQSSSTTSQIDFRCILFQIYCQLVLSAPPIPHSVLPVPPSLPLFPPSHIYSAEYFLPYPLYQGSVHRPFLSGSGSKYFWLCEPCRLCPSYAVLLLGAQTQPQILHK